MDLNVMGLTYWTKSDWNDHCSGTDHMLEQVGRLQITVVVYKDVNQQLRVSANLLQHPSESRSTEML